MANLVTTHRNDFYLTLPSDSSAQFFPANTLSDYRTKLPYPIQLKGRWEVGLAELIYPKSWPNVPYCFFYYSLGGLELQKVEIKAGHFESIDGVLQGLVNQMSPRARQQIMFEFDSQKKRIKVIMRKGARIVMSDRQMCILLGVGATQNKLWEEGEHECENTPDLYLGFYSLYVYCNMVEPVIVGDTSVPLLRVVPVDGSYGSIITRAFDKPHYVPVLTNNFETVDINIATDMGDYVKFEFGKVVIKLHFRPRKLAFM